MGASKKVFSLTIMLAMILSNVIDIQESQACPGIDWGDVFDAVVDSTAHAGRSLQSPGISLSINLFIENIQF